MTESENIASQIAKALQAAAVLPHERRLWSVERICDYFDVSDSTAYRCILASPDFPVPVKIEGGPQRWVAGEVMAWAEAQRREVRCGKRAA